MAQKKVWIGSTGPFLFDDSILYIDEEGVIAPDNQQAIATNGQIVVQSPPTSDVHVVRKYELDRIGATLGLGTMAYQNAHAVAITGGQGVFSSIALGIAHQLGHVLDVLGYSQFNSPVGIEAIPQVGYSIKTGGSLLIQGNIDCTVPGTAIYATRIIVNADFLSNGVANFNGMTQFSDSVGIEAVPQAGYSLKAGGPVMIQGNLDCTVPGTAIYATTLITLADGTVGGVLTVNGLSNFNGTAQFNSPVGFSIAPVAGMSVAIGGNARAYGTFQVDGTTQLTGYVGFGGPTQVGYRQKIHYDKTTTSGIMFQPYVSNTGGGVNLQFLNISAVTVGTISNDGSTTYYNTTSDARLKHAVTAITGALDVVRALRPVAFRWNADDSQGYGFLAHELQQVVADAVIGEADMVNEDGSINPQQVDNSKLVPWLTACCKELLDKLSVLTARVDALEAQLAN